MSYDTPAQWESNAIAEIMDQKMSDYKKIATVSGKKKSYEDKKVKNNHYYAYVVNAYKKVKGKYKLAYTSYNSESYEYCCRRLGIPELLNGGDGENFSNSKSCVLFFIASKQASQQNINHL